MKVLEGLSSANLTVERDSANVIAWASGRRNPPSRLRTIARDISYLCKDILNSFRQVGRSRNEVVDLLPKVGDDQGKGFVGHL